MARKNNARADQSGICVFDSRTKAVMAQSSQEGVKEKVAAVREVISDRNKNEVILVLQYYDYDVERTIQAYLEDGAKEALQEWHYPGNKPPSKKKKKNKNKKDQKDATVNGPSTAPSGEQTENLTASASVSSTSHQKSLGSVDRDVSSSSPQDQKAPPASSGGTTARPLPQRARSTRHSHTAPADKTADPTVSSQQVHTSLTRGQPHQQEGKHAVRPHTLHTGAQESRPRSISEASSVSTSGERSTKPHAGLQRSMKDLQRQTTSLQRLKMVLSEGIEKSFHGIKSCFQELQTEINNREVELLTEMDKVKKDAFEVIAMRQKKAADLKIRTDRHMNDQELLELRADIKQFVTDRKVDEDLCETKRFVYDLKSLVQQVQNFGEVVAVRPSYSQRRPSLSSIASSHDDFQSPLSSVPSTPLTPAPPVSASAHFNVTDSSLTTQELAELQHRLQVSLKLQGLAVKSPPSRHPASRGHSAPVKAAAGGAQNTNTEDNQAAEDAKKGRPARRRQRIREREREDRNRPNDTRTPSPTKQQQQQQQHADDRNKRTNTRTSSPSKQQTQQQHADDRNKGTNMRTSSPAKNEARPQRPAQHNRRADSVPKQNVNSDPTDASHDRAHSSSNRRQYNKRNSPEKVRETNGNVARVPSGGNKRVSGRGADGAEKQPDLGAGGDNNVSAASVEKSKTVTSVQPTSEMTEDKAQPADVSISTQKATEHAPEPQQPKMSADDTAQPPDSSDDQLTANKRITEHSLKSQKISKTPELKSNGEAAVVENGDVSVLVNGVNGDSH